VDEGSGSPSSVADLDGLLGLLTYKFERGAIGKVRGHGCQLEIQQLLLQVGKAG